MIDNSLSLEELCEQIKAESKLEQLRPLDYDNILNSQERNVSKNLLPNFDAGIFIINFFWWLVHYETIMKNEQSETNFAANIVELSENIMRKLENLKTASSQAREKTHQFSVGSLTSGKSIRHFLDFDKENMAAAAFPTDIVPDGQDKIQHLLDEM